MSAGSGGRGRVVAVWVIVVVLLVVDVVLVALAFTATRPASSGDEARPGSGIPQGTPNGPAQTSPPSGDNANPSPTTEPPAPPLPEASPRVLAAVSATSAWRVDPAACLAEPAIVEHSGDGGANWQDRRTGSLPIHTVFRFTVAGTQRIDIVADAGSDCEVGYFRSFTSGVGWEEARASLASASYLDPADRDSIVISGSAETAPCDAALQLAVRDDAVAVLCEGEIALRGLAGEGVWATAELPGVLAVTATPDGFTIARAGVTGCDGVALQALPATDAAVEPATIGCAPVADPDQLTVSQAGTALWLWSGDTVLVSADAGRTW